MPPDQAPRRPYPPVLHDGDPEASAWLRRAEGPPDITFPGGSTCELLATGDQTDGRFGLYRWTFGEGESGPDPHFHRTMSEQFYVLDGEVRVHDGTSWKTAHPGDFLYVPPGGIHGFRGSGGASMLLMFTPGAPREAYFRTLAEDPPTDEETLNAFLDAHDNHYL
ncbi:cupin domain-containing protein [Euzebya tangerina]|uniref:cupin domain-containing protein n=1 Tax=Euzebya tangerina TaxID=591198 RepID=UPI00196ABCDA|nr:cupin domain-containing protein [Euzebya tangerina]